ncbi:PH domain-containing protein [Nocardioides sp. zg-579]|uniref:PH domain-containing protein n=1 Tax=Nocardioides marmotae TaxID=2663857 RepID=A0A6I3JGR3_9ACTN|nr:PH domain-containing protein [Nocardioides marmotae]MCR6033703.1 PH domain-containing protein [Gordonia jinghuaiqii]MTB97361.1 PH domain-containing protein [Nocardioides marmotae]QKE01700.1 PH domain-containing protein [Nocardioides marmotae]
MPAGSEAGPRAAGDGLPRTWRPLGPRIVATVLSSGMLVILLTAWISFGAETRAKFTPFQLGTIIFFIILGGVVLWALTRARVTATREGLTVVNGFRTRSFTWAEVVAVHLPPGAPWATIDLSDGRTVSVMGLQGSDGERARAAVRELRRLADELS